MLEEKTLDELFEQYAKSVDIVNKHFTDFNRIYDQKVLNLTIGDIKQMRSMIFEIRGELHFQLAMLSFFHWIEELNKIEVV